MAVQVNELNSVVKQHIIKELPDGLQKATPLMDWLAGDGKKKQTGGLYIQFPIKLIANQSSGFINGQNAITDVTPSQQLQYGVLNWKYYYVNANFTLEDFNIATGPEMVVDFIKAKTKGAMDDAIREISASMHGSSSADATKPEGLQDVVAASGTAYAGLLDTDYDSDAYLPLITTDNTVNYTNISKMIIGLKARMQKANLDPKGVMGLTNAGVFQKFMTAVQAQQLFGVSKAVAESGFQGFSVNGVDFYLDADCPGSEDGATADNYLYILPKKVLNLYYNFGFGSDSPLDGKVQMPNQPITSTQHYMTFNLVCNNRRAIAVNKTFIG